MSIGIRHARGGFTLIELLVVLAIAGLIVLTAHRVLSATVDQSRRVIRARTQLDQEENATRWLGEAIASLDVGKDDPGPFVGTTGEIRFSTRLLTPYGWHEVDRVTLRQEGDRLVARLASGAEVQLADSIAAVEFDYLVEHGEAAPWLVGWTSSVNPPLAVRVRLRRVAESPAAPERVDTTLLIVGSRG